MHSSKRAFLTLAAAGLLLPAGATTPWPSRPVRLVVPFPPGGGTDIVARALGRRLGAGLGQSVVVDNKPGAATVIGTDAVAKADPDGHTLLLSGSSTYSVNPALRPKLPYDPVKDLAPVAVVARAPLALVVHAASPYRTLDDLVAQARRQPGTINYATFGTGSAPHLAGALLELAAGIRLQDIPYKGSAPALTGLIGGEIQMAVDTVAATAPHIRAGKLRALAIVGSVRSSELPDVATLADLKLPDANLDAWYAVAAPAGTPEPVLQRAQREISAAVRDPEVVSQLHAQALEPVFLGPAAMRSLIETEIARYRALAHRARIAVE